MTAFTLFTGNCPHNVSKDAKYSVRDTDGHEVGVVLLYRADENERWRLATRDHPELVEMVNDVKRMHGSGPKGPFYINEYKQVIVPVGDEAQYYLAGTYEQPLQFEFEGKIISGEPFDLDGKPLRPGDLWTGPHAGIPYVLTAAGDDVYYRTFPRPDVEKRVRLSATRGKSVAVQVARMLSAFKGAGGGRFYVNEFCSVFCPVNRTDNLQYIYIGQMDLASWFPAPSITATV
jgi:hypothetical protein